MGQCPNTYVVSESQVANELAVSYSRPLTPEWTDLVNNFHLEANWLVPPSQLDKALQVGQAIEC